MPISSSTWQKAAQLIVNYLSSRYNVTGWYQGTMEDVAHGIIQAIVEDDYKVQSGRVAISAKDGTITFPVAYTSVPTVVALSEGHSDFHIDNITTTGFDWHHQQNVTTTVNYIARGL